MAYDEMEGGCSADMKCPHCGASMKMTATKGEGMGGPPETHMQGPEDMDGKTWSDEDFRKAMSPRNNDEPDGY